MAKTYIQRMAEVVAKKHNLSMKDAEEFVSSLFAVIHEGLDEDKLVKVKGLGTFKVTAVKARESVNVNTGERVVIESHDKVSFTPDKAMAEQVNKPFAQFETVVLNDGVEFKEEEKEERGERKEEREEEIEEREERKEEREMSVPSEEEEASAPTEKQEENTEEQTEELKEEQTEELGLEEYDTEEDKPVADSTSRRRIWVIVVLFLLIAAAAAAYFWYNHEQEKKALPPLPKEMVEGPKKKVAPKPAPQPVDTTAVLLETANRDPRVRAGAYDIVGIDTVVTLRPRQTMHSYCKHTLGELMIVYFQALNGVDSLHEGQTMMVPKVKYRSRNKKQ